jgi:hypothetical protein
VGRRGSGLIDVLSQHFPGGTEENNIKLNQDILFRQRFEPRTSGMQI